MIKTIVLLGATVAIAVFASGRSVADEKDKPKAKKEKGPTDGSNIVTIDLGKPPPDVAKELKKLLERSQAPTTSGEKSKPAAKKPEGRTALPPGLANKTADHPGRKAFLEALAKQQAKASTTSSVKLPPGLAKKSPDHPGVKAFLKAHQSKAVQATPAPRSKTKEKGKDKD